MYIAHTCPDCGGQVVCGEEIRCETCLLVEDQDTFWKLYYLEEYERWLESEIEDRYPFRMIRQIGSLIDLSIGWRALGKIDNSDHTVAEVIKNVKALKDKHDVCFYNFDARIEDCINGYLRIAERSKYKSHIESLQDSFKNYSKALKEASR